MVARRTSVIDYPLGQTPNPVWDFEKYSTILDIYNSIHIVASRGALNDIIDVSDFEYGGAFDGVTDDTAAWNKAITEAKRRPGGAVITAPPGTSTVISATVLIDASNIQFWTPNLKVIITGNASLNAFHFLGLGVLGHPTFAVIAAAYQNVVIVTALNGAVVGGYFMLDTPDPAGFDLYGHLSRIKNITGAGPWNIILDSPLPFATVVGTSQLTTFSPLSKVGFLPGSSITIDGAAATGAIVHGVKIEWVVDSEFCGIHGENILQGSAIQSYYGLNVKYTGNSAKNCGNLNYAALHHRFQTGAQGVDHLCYAASGFGWQLQNSSYCKIVNFSAEGSAYRGGKLQTSLFCNLSNGEFHGNGYNGFGVAGGSCFNNFTNFATHYNLLLEGFWFSNQFNEFNKLVNWNGFGNGARDIYVGATDTDNVVTNFDCGVIEIHNGTTLWNNGASVAMGKVLQAHGMQGAAPSIPIPVTRPDLNLAATYANDAAAAAGGILVGEEYRNGSVKQIRIV